jgi:hypothetical protein
MAEERINQGELISNTELIEKKTWFKKYAESKREEMPTSISHLRDRKEKLLYDALYDDMD